MTYVGIFSLKFVFRFGSQVCSAWIGSEISSDISDVRRIQQLLTTSLDKLSKEEDQSKRIYSESAYTLETLAVLKAWAQVSGLFVF